MLSISDWNGKIENKNRNRLFGDLKLNKNDISCHVFFLHKHWIFSCVVGSHTHDKQTRDGTFLIEYFIFCSPILVPLYK